MKSTGFLKRMRISFIIAASLFFYTLTIAAVLRNVYITPNHGESWFGDFAKSIRLFAEIPGDLKTFITCPPAEDSFYNSQLLTKDSIQKDGFTYHEKIEYENSPKLLIVYKKDRFENLFQLLDINTGTIVKQWIPDSKLLSEKTFNKAHNMFEGVIKNTDYYYFHPLMLSDSSIVTHNQLSLIKIDKNSMLEWVKNDKYYHHSIQQDIDGNIYVPTHPFYSRFFDFFPTIYNDTTHNYWDDEITKIDSKSGEILFCKSVTEILIDNGYKWLLLAKGQVDRDQIHLNDIEPANYDSEYWKKGDLLLSSRHLSAVILYRPSTNKILWLKMGPWYNQHDVDFLGVNKIVVFGNDVLRFRGKDNNTDLHGYFSDDMPRNQVYVYDFENDEITTPYDALMKTENIKTPSQGRCDILPNGDIFIEETDKGRLFFGDFEHAKITFAKRKDAEYLHLIHWGRIVY